MDPFKGLDQIFHFSLCGPPRSSPRLRPAPLHCRRCPWQYPIVLASSQCRGLLLQLGCSSPASSLGLLSGLHPVPNSSTLYDLCLPTKLVPLWWFLSLPSSPASEGSNTGHLWNTVCAGLRKHFSGFTSLALVSFQSLLTFSSSINCPWSNVLTTVVLLY